MLFRLKFLIVGLVFATTGVWVGGGGCCGGVVTPTTPIIPVVSVIPDSLINPTPVTPVSLPSDQPDWDTLENLIGQVTFKHQTTGASELFVDTVVFTPSSIVAESGADRILVAQNDQGSFFCSEFPVEYDFICGFIWSATGSETFAVVMDSQLTGSGPYELCEGTPEECGRELVVSPDGRVEVTISRVNTKQQNAVLANGQVTVVTASEALDFKRANKLEFGSAAGAGEVGDKQLLEMIELVQQRARAVLNR